MRFRNKRGIALISVVLISALVFLSIISIYVKTVTEKNISVARISTDRALAAAEGVLSNIAFDLSDADVISEEWKSSCGSCHFLTISEIKNLLDSNSSSTGEKDFSPSPDTKINVKMKVISVDYLVDPPLYTVRVSSLATVYKDPASSSVDAIARKAILVDYLVNYKPSSNYVFNYALFTPGAISLGGNATINGDTYAGEGVNGKGSAEINGTAYIPPGANVIPNNLADNVTVLPNELPFPPLDVEYYKQRAYNFKYGNAPYNGTELGYPNINTGLKTAIQLYLGTVDTSTIDGISNFYNDLKTSYNNISGGGTAVGFFALPGITAGDIINLWTNIKSVAYYIDGDVHINGQFELQGVLVIKGSLIINGGAEIETPGGLAVYVDGDIEVANGNASLHGLFYSTGTIGGKGTFDCTGSIVTNGNIDLKGDFQVDFEMVKEMEEWGQLSGEEGGLTYNRKAERSWKEISLEDFNSF